MKFAGRMKCLLVLAVVLVGMVEIRNGIPAEASGDFSISNGVLTKYNGSRDCVAIPDGVTSIGDSAFDGCTDILEILIPKSVTSIGRYAFHQCTGLKSVTFPGSVTAIGNYAFYQCEGLKSVTFSANLRTIGIRSFSGCTRLAAVTVPSGVTSIGNYAFEDCSALKSASVLSNVKSFGTGVFSDCGSLTISGYKNTAIQTYAGKNGIPFKSIGLGSLNLDTKSYVLTPKSTYTIGVSLVGSSLTLKSYSSSGTVASVKAVSSHAYQVTGLKSGTTYIMFDVYSGSKRVSHASVKITVERGVTPHGSGSVQTARF